MDSATAPRHPCRDVDAIRLQPDDAGPPVFSDVLVERPGGALDAVGTLGASREYNIDLAPKAAFCAGPMVGALLASGAHNYLEFKLLQGR
jgi:GDP dissociation inhibitor